MNNEIIPIHEENGNFPVNGRELHARLEIETPYHKWFPRMCEYGFDGEKDYRQVSDKIVQNPLGGRPAADHMLTLNMAKEICMLQRTEKGREVRRYLIQVEEAWNSPEKVMARALQIAEHTLANFKEEVKLLAEKNAEMLPKAEFYDAVVESPDAVDMAVAAKTLNMGVGRNTMFKILREAGILQKDNTPYQTYVDRGYFRCIESKFSMPDGTQHINIKTVVQQKGLDFIRKVILNAQNRKEYAE